MQVKFASAASGITKGGEASIGVAAWAVAVSANEAAAIVTSGQAARSAVRPASFYTAKENKKQVASRLSGRVRPARPHRLVPRGTPVPAPLPTLIARPLSSAGEFGGTFSASVWPAAQATLEIGVTILAGGVYAGKEMPSALDARRCRVGLQAGSAPACRHPDADFAQFGEGRVRKVASNAVHAGFGIKKCAASIETPNTPKAMSTTHTGARTAPFTLGGHGGSRDGDITPHDFKDSGCAVLDVVKV
jgi:hypothetical protein